MAEKNQEKRSKNSFEEMMDLISQPVFIVDQRLLFVYANQAFEAAVGDKLSEVIGKPLDELTGFSQEVKAALAKMTGSILQGEKIESYEFSLTDEGKTKYFESTGKIIDYFGQPANIVILNDVTERKRQLTERRNIENSLNQRIQFENTISNVSSRFVSSLDFDAAVNSSLSDIGKLVGASRGTIFLINKTKKNVITNIYEWCADGVDSLKLNRQNIQVEDLSWLEKLRREGHIQIPDVSKLPKETDAQRESLEKCGVKSLIVLPIYIAVEFEGFLFFDNVESSGFWSKENIGVLRIYSEIVGAAIGGKKTFDALRSSEERFLGIANSVRDAIVLVDEKAAVTYWNPAAEKIFGYTDKEALGKSVHELVVPKSICREGIDRIDNSVKTFGETGMGYFTVGTVELIGRRKNGDEFPAELSISPVKLCGKQSAVGVVSDVTRRKQNEQKLRDAEQRYHALFNQAPLGVLVVDPETAGFVEFNDITHLQLGYSREEFEKMTVYDIEAIESPEKTEAHLKGLAAERGAEFETAHRTKNGEIKNILVTSRSFQSAGKTFLHCIYRDITEIKKVQNALMESEARYRQLVELAQEGIWAVDNDFATVFVNPRMAEMLGYAESEMMGKNLFDFLDPEKVEKIKGILQEFKERKIERAIEYAFPRKNGTHIYTTITMSTITDDQGQISGMLAVIADITRRKQAEKALRESEELSKAIVANAPIGIATSDESFHFVSANEAFCRILGYTEDELRKLTFKEITHPEDLAESARKMLELETGKLPSFVMEKRYIRKDGAQIIGRVITNAIRNQTGQPILYIAELEDITKSKQLEDDLRGSEERFRAISASAMDAIILSDEEDRVIYWNPAAEKTFGFMESEAVGRKLAELVIPPHGLASHKELLKELREHPLSKKHFGLSALKKDGSLFPMDLTVVSLQLKDKHCLLSTIRDITESKAMEEALKRERDMLENMATSIDAGLTLIGRDYRILWANKLLKQINGSELENKLCYSIYDKSNQICQDCGVKKVFENGAAVDRHDYNFKFDGRDEWVELIVTPVKGKDGKVIAALELAVNITERKRLQTKLGEYSQKLEELVQKRTMQLKTTQAELVKSERLAAIGELAGMVGHDLRNPLTGIKNSAYFLKKKGTEISPAQAQEMLETIDKCVNYSNKIVNDLLDYSREVHLELQEESLKKLLAESLSLLDLPEKIEIQDYLGGEPTVNVDVNKIKRVFINLIKNAVDAMPNGGIITISSQQVNGRLEVSFTDTGRGISDEVLPKLFMPLFTTKAQGMGFGLAICKRIIEAHGGSITVKTVKEKGTTFTITLPVEPKFQVGGENTWINIPESS